MSNFVTKYRRRPFFCGGQVLQINFTAIFISQNKVKTFFEVKFFRLTFLPFSATNLNEDFSTFCHVKISPTFTPMIQMPENFDSLRSINELRCRFCALDKTMRSESLKTIGLCMIKITIILCHINSTP